MWVNVCMLIVWCLLVVCVEVDDGFVGIILVGMLLYGVVIVVGMLGMLFVLCV